MNKNIFNEIKASLSTKSESPFKDVMKFETGKTYIVRLVPNVDAPARTLYHYYHHSWNSFCTGQFVTCLCPTTYGESCPIDSHVIKNFRTGSAEEKEKVKPIARKESWLVNAYVVSDPTNPENEGKNIFFSPLGWGRSKLSDLVMPWVTYTDPEIAHVGLYAKEALAQGLETNEIKIPFSSVDRAIYDGETDGFVKILHQKGSDRILGATIVARHAGEMISEITLAIATKQGLNKLSGVIHSYPTQADAIKKAADAYRKTLLTPRTQSFLKLLAKFS
jgi:hypothetical protein